MNTLKNHLLTSVSYIMHPLLMPVFGVLFFFYCSPQYFPNALKLHKLLSVILLTVALPLLFFFLLKTLRLVTHSDLKHTKERLLPLTINCAILFLIIRNVFPKHQTVELHYFFLGLLYSALTCLVLVVFKIKASIHLMVAASFFMFALAVGIHFKLNIALLLALACFGLGALATSRLHLKAHTNKELWLGFVLGAFPQLTLLKYWL